MDSNKINELKSRIKSKPNVFFRYSKMKKKQGYIFIDENYFISNFLNSKGSGIQINVFKQPQKDVNVNIFEVKNFYVSEKPI